MKPAIKKDLLILLDYISPGELKHYEESEKPKKHIYHTIRRLRKSLKELEGTR